MDDAIGGSKELLHETMKAFKTGLHGEDYVPGAPLPPKIHLEEEMKKLEDLRESGTLTDDEFQAARARLLKDAGTTPDNAAVQTDLDR